MSARILLIDHDLASQRANAYSLREGGYEVVVAVDAAEALKTVRSSTVDLIVAGVGEAPSFEGIEFASRLRAKERSTQIPILLFGTGPDVETRVRALRAGANDYLVQPFHPGELLAKVRGLLVRFAPKDISLPGTANGRVFAFYGAKGGVGTTSILLNTAVALHRERQRRVVAVDAKLQFGDLRVFLDLALQTRTMIDLVEAPSIDADLMANVVVKHDSGIDVLLAPPNPEAADLVNYRHLAQMLQVLRTMYDYVLVDTDQRLDDNNLQVFDSASTIFVVLTADLSSIKNMQLLLATLSTLAYDSENLRLVLNRASAVTGIRTQSVEAALGRSIDYSITNDYRVAMSALNSGSPFAYRKPSSGLSRSVSQFAASLDVQRSTGLETAKAVRTAPARA